jgi:hypothetical protein
MDEMFSGKPAKSNHITTRFIDDEAVLMNLVTVKTYYLNETASKIWSLIDGARTVDSIIHELMELYDVPEDECSDEVSRLLKSLNEDQLIHFSDEHA